MGRERLGWPTGEVRLCSSESSAQDRLVWVAFGWNTGHMTVTSAETHRNTARMDIHEVVRQLNTHLGPTLVAALSGTKDRKLPIRWAKSDGPTPGPDFNRRLQFAHRVWTFLASAESDQVARSWFIGANPALAEDTPLTGIREDHFRQVTAAADAFVNDQIAS